MRIKIFHLFFIFNLIFFPFVNSNPVSADGGMIAPSFKKIYETDQKAVIFYDQGIENLILSVTYRGNAKDFAWIIPTPNQPEVEKSADSLFTKLDEITKPEVKFNNPLSSGFGSRTLEATDNGVTVLETKSIDYFSVNVLEATDSDSLYNWLNDNGYNLPQAGKYITDEYINNKWFFTAIKINDERLSTLTENQLNTGHATPLMLKFKTDKIVYPLKISSLTGIEDSAPVGKVTYIDGNVGKGVMLDSNKVLATDRIIENFNPDNGSVSFSFKKRNSDGIGRILELKKDRQGLSSIGEGIVITNNFHNKFQVQLNKIFSGKNYLKNLEIDLGSDFQLNAWQSLSLDWSFNPSNPDQLETHLLIDGKERILNQMFSSAYQYNQTGQGDSKSQLIIGGFGNYASANNYQNQSTNISADIQQYYTGRQNDLLIDSLRINSNKSLVANANFDEDLNIDLIGKQNQLRIFSSQNTIQKNDYQIPSSVGILLYIFSDKKQEVTGFNTQYGGWINKSDIQNLATIEGEKPWIEPSKNKYFLSRMYSMMNIAQMNEDLYPQESKDQSPINSPLGESGKLTWLIILIALSVLVIIGLVVFVIRTENRNRRSTIN
jgi:hypothetical protein